MPTNNEADTAQDGNASGGASNSSHRPNVTTLATPERLAAIPEEYKLNVTEPKGHQGICVGREKELERIHSYFATQYRDEAAGLLGEDDCIACIVTNAPGSGKTTVREQFMREAEDQGIACIELSTGDLMHPQAFVEAIIDYAKEVPDTEPEGESKDEISKRKSIRDRLETAFQRIKSNPSAWVGAMAGTMSEAFVGEGTGSFVALGTTQLLERRTHLAEQLAGELERTGTVMSVTKALEILTESHDGQYILTVDEGQAWADPKLDRDSLHEVLSVICNPSKRKKSGIRGGGLLISGLGNVKDHLDGLGLSRAEIIWMSELTQKESEEIIRHAIEKLSEDQIGGDRRTRLLREWPPSLAGSFSHWPQHAGIAGRIAQKMILQLADGDEDDEAIEWVRTKAAELISDLYGVQLDKAIDDGDRHAPAILAAMADINHGVLPTDAVQIVIERRRAAKGLTYEPEDVKHTIGIMKRTGILMDTRVRRPDGTTEKEYRIGIPSIKDYTLQRTSESKRDEAFKLAREALDASESMDDQPDL